MREVVVRPSMVPRWKSRIEALFCSLLIPASLVLLVVPAFWLADGSLLADDADFSLRVRPLMAFSPGPVVLEATLASTRRDPFEVGPFVDATTPTDSILIDGPGDWGPFSSVQLEYRPPGWLDQGLRTEGAIARVPTSRGYWIMPSEERTFLLPVHAMFDGIRPGPAPLVVTWDLQAMDEHRTGVGGLRQVERVPVSVSAAVELNLVVPTEADVRVIEVRVEEILKQDAPSPTDRHFALAVLVGQKGEEWMPLTFDLLRAWNNVEWLEWPEAVRAFERWGDFRQASEHDWCFDLCFRLTKRAGQSEVIRTSIVKHLRTFGESTVGGFVRHCYESSIKLPPDEARALCESVHLRVRQQAIGLLPRADRAAALKRVVEEYVTMESVLEVGRPAPWPARTPLDQSLAYPRELAGDETVRELLARLERLFSSASRPIDEVESAARDVTANWHPDLVPWAYRLLEREPDLSADSQAALREYVFASFGLSGHARARLLDHLVRYGMRDDQFMFERWQSAGTRLTEEEVARLVKADNEWIRILTICTWPNQCRPGRAEEYRQWLQGRRQEVQKRRW
jgi:hypothetical protein